MLESPTYNKVMQLNVHAAVALDGCLPTSNTNCIMCRSVCVCVPLSMLSFRLYAFMEGLLEVEIGIASMADVLTEVFTGGPDLCLKVKEDQVARLFSLIARDDLPEGRPELLHALQAMAKVNQDIN